MDIGIGVYDILNASEVDPEVLNDTNINYLLPKSTEQIINIKEADNLSENPQNDNYQ